MAYVKIAITLVRSGVTKLQDCVEAHITRNILMPRKSNMENFPSLEARGRPGSSCSADICII